jgi:uncharacterized protein YcnI
VRLAHKLGVGLAVGFVLTLLLAAPAHAHGTLTPPTVVAGTTQQFELVVPNGRQDADIVAVSLGLPAGMRLETAEARQPEWTVSSSGTMVTWEGGPVARGSSDTFVFTASAPARPGRVELTLVERYDDGVAPPFPLPLSVTAGAGGSGGSETLAAIALAVAALALVAATAALVLALRRSSSPS